MGKSKKKLKKISFFFVYKKKMCTFVTKYTKKRSLKVRNYFNKEDGR